MTITTTPSLTPEQLLDPAVLEDPYPFYRQLVADAPVWRIPGTDVILVSSFDAITEVANRTGDFSSNLLGLLFRKDDGTPGVAPFDPGIHASLSRSRERGAMNRRNTERQS